MHGPSTIIEKLRHIAANTAIVVLLLFMALQSLPGVPDGLHQWACELGDVAGLSQGHWSMFANPDRANQRLRATIEYGDGTSVMWDSPDWPTLGLGERFVGARRMEYIEAIGTPDYEAALEDLADWLGRTEAPSPEARPRRVEIWLDEGRIPDPRFHGWQSRAATIPLEKHSLLFEKDYP